VREGGVARSLQDGLGGGWEGAERGVVRGVSGCAARKADAKKVARGAKKGLWGILGGLRGEIGARDARARTRRGTAFLTQINADERGWH
jgi:hypothetical protein